MHIRDYRMFIYWIVSFETQLHDFNKSFTVCAYSLHFLHCVLSLLLLREDNPVLKISIFCCCMIFHFILVKMHSCKNETTKKKKWNTVLWIIYDKMYDIEWWHLSLLCKYLKPFFLPTLHSLVRETIHLRSKMVYHRVICLEVRCLNCWG